jgi:hypothetical protein
VEGVVPRPDIAPLLKEHFVALAADCDDPEAEVLTLATELEDAMMLPFVLIADAHGKFVTGSSGAVTPAGLRAMLESAIA